MTTMNSQTIDGYLVASSPVEELAELRKLLMLPLEERRAQLAEVLRRARAAADAYAEQRVAQILERE